MDVYSELQKLTNCRNVTLVSRGNKAILAALRFAKTHGYERVYIPDVGGWMMYEPLAKKAKLSVIHIETDDGMIDPSTLMFEENSVVLVHALAGYHKALPMLEIKKVCEACSCLLIEDCVGLLSYPTVGDIVVGSFGKAKPINFGEGGFVATNNDDWHSYFAPYSESFDSPTLLEKILHVRERLTFLYAKRDEFRAKFSDAGFHVLGDMYALVLIIPYDDEEEKTEIVRICSELKVEYTECPRYIRSNRQAISVEVKRLTT